jgi:hypothetical protein
LKKEGFFNNFLDYFNKSNDDELKLSPLFANYFFVDFYYSNLLYEFLYFFEDAEENIFFWSLNYFHFYHFDYFSNVDLDLAVKFKYKSFSGNLDDFLFYAYSSDVSTQLIIDFNDVRNGFF